MSNAVVAYRSEKSSGLNVQHQEENAKKKIKKENAEKKHNS